MQDFEHLISTALHDEYNKSTYPKMARRSGLSTSYIQELLTGKKKIKSLSLEKLYELFPTAILSLDGGVVTGDNSIANIGSPSAVAINGIAHIEDKSEILRAQIIMGILDLDLSPDIQSKILKVIKNTKL